MRDFGSEVKDANEKVVLGDTEDSKLEVRGGYSDHWAHWSCGVSFERGRA